MKYSIKQLSEINNRRGEIAKFATDKFNLEQDGNPSIHTHAHVEPETNSKVSQENKALDALARLIVNDEICAAVCYVKEELLIATNKTKPKYAPDYIKKLKDYINAPFKVQYQALADEGYKQSLRELNAITKDNLRIQNIENNLSRETARSYRQGRSHDVDALTKISKDFSALIYGQHNKENKENLEEICKRLYNSNISSIKNIAIDVIRPLRDTEIVAEAVLGIADAKIALSHEIINAIINIKNENYLSDLDNKHAEMKISEVIDEKGNSNKEYYIGISKLACCCWIALDIQNEKNKDINKSIKVLGTAGGSYAGWLGPSWMLIDEGLTKNFKDKFGNELPQHKKAREAGPFDGKMSSSLPFFTRFNSMSQLQSHLSRLQSNQANTANFNNEIRYINNYLENRKKIFDVKEQLGANNLTSPIFSNNSSTLLNRDKTWLDGDGIKKYLDYYLPKGTDNLNKKYIEKKFGANSDVEDPGINNVIMLKEALQQHNGDSSVIYFQISKDTKKLDEGVDNTKGRSTNHWVGIHISENAVGVTILYIDPMGGKCSAQVENLIKEVFKSKYEKNVNVTNTISKNKGNIQYTESEKSSANNEINQDNDSDCGYFIAYLLAATANKIRIQQGSLDKDQSEYLGQALRNGDVFPNSRGSYGEEKKPIEFLQLIAEKIKNPKNIKQLQLKANSQNKDIDNSKSKEQSADRIKGETKEEIKQKAKEIVKPVEEHIFSKGNSDDTPRRPSPVHNNNQSTNNRDTTFANSVNNRSSKTNLGQRF